MNGCPRLPQCAIAAIIAAQYETGKMVRVYWTEQFGSIFDFVAEGTPDDLVLAYWKYGSMLMGVPADAEETN